MRLVAAIIILIPAVTFLWIRDKSQILAPRNAFSVLYFLRIMLPAVIYANTGVAGRISDGYVSRAVLSNENYLSYAVLQTASYYCVIFGMRLVFGTRKYTFKHSNINVSQGIKTGESLGEENYKHYLYWGIVFTLIGFVDFLLIMQRSGGLVYFFTHLQYRTIILRDLDLLSWILILLHYGPLLIVYSMRGRNKKISYALFALVILSGFMCGLGGRKTMLIMIIEMIFVYHFTVREIKIKDVLRPRNIAILILIYVFFIVIVQFRYEGTFEAFISNPLAFINSNNKSVTSILTGESYVKYYMAVIEYFKEHSYWLGKSFLGLITAFIPSSLYPGKPPVDDGMYLYSICMGRQDIMPVMATRSLNLSSYPLETFGSMYANFGFMGVLIGMIILGHIINRTYKRIEKNNYRVLDIIIYAQMLFGFELSTLRIFQILEIFIMLGVIVYFVDKLPIKISGRR